MPAGELTHAFLDEGQDLAVRLGDQTRLEDGPEQFLAEQEGEVREVVDVELGAQDDHQLFFGQKNRVDFVRKVDFEDRLFLDFGPHDDAVLSVGLDPGRDERDQVEVGPGLDVREAALVSTRRSP